MGKIFSFWKITNKNKNKNNNNNNSRAPLRFDNWEMIDFTYLRLKFIKQYNMIEKT